LGTEIAETVLNKQPSTATAKKEPKARGKRKRLPSPVLSWSFDDEPPSLDEMVSRAWAGLWAGLEKAQAMYEYCTTVDDLGAPDVREWLMANLPIEFVPDATSRGYTADAWIALTRAELALQTGEQEQARSHLLRAEDFQKLACESYEANAPKAIRRLSGSKGGQKTAEHTEGVIELCASLLWERRPPSGWTTPRNAAKALFAEVDDFLVQNPPPTMRSAKAGPASTRAEDWIVGRIKKPGKIRDAYLANSAKALVSQPAGDGQGG
jgi:hypothetical protein